MRGGRPICVWPEQSWSAEEISALNAQQAEPCRRHLNPERMEFTQPLTTQGVHFATLFLQCELPADQADAVAQLLVWSHAWLELLGNQNRQKSAQYQQILDIIEKSSAGDSLAQNSHVLCSLLATQLDLKQVVFLTCHRGKTKVLSVSKVPQYDSRTQPFAQLTAYIDSLHRSGAEDAKVAFAAWLSRNLPETLYQNFAVQYEQQTFGYLVIFYPSDHRDISSEKAKIALFLRYLAPLYFKLYWTQLSFFGRQYDRFSSWLRRRPSPVQFAVYGGVLITAMALLLTPVPVNIKAEAHLEGLVQRAIVVPEDGFLKEVFVKTGEVIHRGQLLAQLDQQAIRLDIQRWQNEKQEYEREYHRELTALNHGQMRIAQAKMAQAQAKLSQFQNRLEKTRITAPIDGVVIKGDLSRAVGAPVKQGQVLYEMAPDDEFKLVLLVAQDDIIKMRSGQQGKLKLNAFPGNPLAFEIEAISSVFEEHGAQVQYRVEARLFDTAEGLRPGMSGTGKVSTQKQALLWVLLQPMVRQLKLWWWIYLG